MVDLIFFLSCWYLGGDGSRVLLLKEVTGPGGGGGEMFVCLYVWSCGRIAGYMFALLT